MYEGIVSIPDFNRRYTLQPMIPVAKPDVGERELKEVQEALKSGWIGLGPKVEEFEEAFGSQFGHENIIATNSGTSALDLALKSVDLSGTELLVPPITWISTAIVGRYNGLDVGWVDVRPDTLNMSPEALRERITEDTAAVIPVHYGGQPADVHAIVEIAHEHDAVVIEDCAHAVGTTVYGEPVGSVGDVGCFSFQATKPLTMGEGGALVTDDDKVGMEAKLMSKLGVDKSTHERSEEEGYSWYYEVIDVGYKYFMHDISAGMGLAQLERLPQMRARRNEVANAYRTAFKDVDWILPPADKDHVTNAHYNYTVRVPSSHREKLIEHLGENDVGATVHYMPLYKHPVFAEHDPDVPVTKAVWEEILTLPMSSTFTEEEVATVIDTLTAYGKETSIGKPKSVHRPSSNND